MKDHSDIVFGLGLDTGGTYTDAVIVNLQTNRVLSKAKARTTHEDLSVGLNEAIEAVLKVKRLERIKFSLVSVLTTLATNSILEGKGGNVGLIGLGWTPEEGCVFGARKLCFLAGGHDVRGRVQAALDADAVERAIEKMAPEVESIAVSSLFSVYNPSHELEVKRIASKLCGIPVVMGHELTGELGIFERTVTAVLNAGLIPVLGDFLQNVRKIMRDRGIEAPVMVFKGDGTLMNIRSAMERPVDTILSGPAASATGGRILTGLDDCVVIDIGGTSTDIAVMENGTLKIVNEGAIVGGWRTRVEAVDMWTMALGGDSEIRASLKQGILIGPERVTPICFAANYLPSIKEKMERLGEARFLMAASRPLTHLTPSEERIINHLLTNGPQTISELKNDLEDIHLLDMFVKSLRRRGALTGIGLTPTDVLHAAGLYTAGDVEAAEMAVGLFSKVLKLNDEDFVKRVMESVSTKIASELLKKVLTDDLGTLTEAPSMQGVIELMTGARSCYNLALNPKIRGPIVGLGGPAKAFISPLGDILDVDILIPQDHDVGNAVGAVCGQVSMLSDVFVYPRDEGYAVYSAFTTPVCFGSERDAIREAKDMAIKLAMERGIMAGGKDLQVEMVFEEEREPSKKPFEKDQLLQMHIRARAVGKPETL